MRRCAARRDNLSRGRPSPRIQKVTGPHLQSGQGWLHGRPRRAVAFLPRLCGRHPVRRRRPAGCNVPQPSVIPAKMDKRRGKYQSCRAAPSRGGPGGVARSESSSIRIAPDRRRRGQEHHRLRCVQVSPRRHQWPAASSPTSRGALHQPSSEVLSIVRPSRSRSSETHRILLGMLVLEADPWRASSPASGECEVSRVA